MKQPTGILFAAAISGLFAGALLVPGSSLGQADVLPPPNLLAPAQPARPAPAPVPAPLANEGAEIAALVAEVAQQQAKVQENQKLIDEKLAVIAENLRIARIYVSRAK